MYQTSFLFLAIALDQLTKLFVRSFGSYSVTSFLTITSTWNMGVGWGLFPCRTSVCRWILIGIELTIISFFVVWYRRSASVWEKRGILCVIAGACGNLLDRLFFGAVFDFLDLYWYRWHFPTFNVADIFISMGFLILMKESLCSGKNKSF